MPRALLQDEPTPMEACITALAAVVMPAAGHNSTEVATTLCGQFGLVADTDATAAALQGTRDGLNTQFLVLTGALVFVMHAGFAMLCAGAIRSKNTMNILLQTILDAAVSAVSFYTVGYGFAYGIGTNSNGFIGNYLFGLTHWESSANGGAAFNGGGWQNWFFQWAFAATATTIPAGAVAERFNFNAYLGYSFFISAFVYPVIVHWVWCGTGWLSPFHPYGALFRSGMIDFAGSGVVHMVGGLSGMMGCILVGPRMGRFDSNGNPVEMPGHSATLVVLGTVLLWFGWYGFNPGSQLLVDSSINAAVVGRAAVITTLGGAGGALSCLFTGFLRNKAWDLLAVCNGALVGFVAITAGSNVLEPWAGLLLGFMGGWIFDAVCILFLKLKIDDPLSAAPMHGFCGMWGVFGVGLLAKREYVCQAYFGGDCSPWRPEGLLYAGDGRLLAAQVIGIISIAAWVCGMMGIFFFMFKLVGKLRISPEEEQAGLDVSKHGGSAYNFDHGLGKPNASAGAPAHGL